MFAALRAHNAALVVADTDPEEGETEPLVIPTVATADWGYLRLRRAAYTQPDLQRWAKTVQEQRWQHAFVFFKHEEAGAGPRLVDEFTALLPRS